MDPVTGPGTTTGSLSSALGGNKALDKEAFLKLLVAQLKNQDPLKPQDSSQFVAELAQFSSLEQAMGINDRLDLLALQSRGQGNSQAVALVGNQVSVRGSVVSVNGTGVGTPVTFTLNGDTEKTVVEVRDQSGRTIRKLDLGANKAGLVQVHWDGRDDAGNIMPAGAYSIGVTAIAQSGAPVAVSQEMQGIVTAVSFDKGYPVLTLDNGTTVPVSDLLKVSATKP
jgi:flagellar basal-body rod modification protein FlgD